MENILPWVFYKCYTIHNNLLFDYVSNVGHTLIFFYFWSDYRITKYWLKMFNYPIIIKTVIYIYNS